MRATEIKVGRHYAADVEGVRHNVRVTSIVDNVVAGVNRRTFRATDLASGEKLKGLTAADFKAEVPMAAVGEEAAEATLPAAKKGANSKPAKKGGKAKGPEPTPLVLDALWAAMEEVLASDRPPEEPPEGVLADPKLPYEGPEDKPAPRPKPRPRPHPRASRAAAPETSVATATAPRPASGGPVLAPNPYANPVVPAGLAESLKANAAKSAAATAPHLVVVARAGTGKTFTLVVGIVYTFRHRVKGLWDELVRRLGFEPVPSPQQKTVWDSMEKSATGARTVQFTAFNRAIVKDFEHTWSWVIDALKAAGIELKFSTLHSLGNKAVFRAFGPLESDDYNVQEMAATILGKEIREIRKEKPMLLSGTARLVSLCKTNLIHQPDEDALDRLASHYEVELEDDAGTSVREEAYALVPEILSRCRDPKSNGRIDFDDMIWLPVVLKLPVFKRDVLLVDEAQDLNPCQQALAMMAGKRLVLCGDPKQAIYGFAGADVEGIPRMEKRLGETPVGRLTFPLTVTRRCGKAIVKEANKIVPDFEAFETNPEGSILTAKYPIQYRDKDPYEIPWEESYLSKAEPGDLILCRVNAPLVSQCFRFLKKGMRANIQGRDVAKGLVSTVTKLMPDEIKRNMAGSVPALIGLLDDWSRAEVDKENAKRSPSDARIIAITDRRDCLVCFCDGLTRVTEVLLKIEAVFTDDRHGKGILLSSIHKAKGMEARRVFLLRPKGAGCPHPMARSAWQQEQEMNLLYVAITRAKEELYYVS